LKHHRCENLRTRIVFMIFCNESNNVAEARTYDLGASLKPLYIGVCNDVDHQK